MTPAEAARAAGVPPSTLRYYERRGFVVPERTAGSGYRHYTDADVRRVRFVQRAQQLGFGMGDVTAFFALADEESLPASTLRTVIDAKLADLDERIADLARMREALATLAETTGDEPCSCPVVESLTADDAPPDRARVT